MAFSNRLAESFGKVIEQSNFVALDPIVKGNYVSKGRNFIFGRNNDPAPNDLIYLGKILEASTGASYLSADAYLDTSFPHVIYITGTRGSGKSMDLGVLLEGLNPLVNESPISLGVTPVATFLIDTQSQFWTLRYPPQGNEGASQLEQLKNWNLKPESLANTKVFIPPGVSGFMGDEVPLKIRPRDILHEEWCSLLGQEVYSPQGHLISEVISKLADRNFDIEDMLKLLREGRFATTVSESSRNVVIYRLSDYLATGLFGADGLEIESLLKPGQCNIFMLRELRDHDKALVTALLARQLFTIMGRYHQERRVADFFNKVADKRNFPSRVWLLIDEAHVVCPSQGESPARAALVEYVKRGRDAGLSLVLATQQPSAVDDRVLSQVNLAFSHRLTFQSDINSAMARIPTKVPSGMRVSGSKVSEFGDILRLLEAGQCFIGDHSTSRAVLIQIRPRITAHGGQSPI
ncbi:ATP-binding protein [Pseudomonas sp. NBRC 111130]|uniref:ATP-binding protein n=1 Tax=Pseudomonas sp. NBRC 111130 TaxID=1661045 RepID=UPI000B1F5D09|nr:ATP-binding protein [Pseudomonas sp. NBRC 111130]